MRVHADFFQPGATLSEDAPSYIERKADHELLNALERRNLCLVLAPRQTGKSSLMVHSISLLRKRNISPAIVDLQMLGSHRKSEDWFGDVIYQIERTLKISVNTQEWWKINKGLGPTTRFMAFLEDVILKECDGNVVIFFDEIDSVLRLPFSDDFFTTIRSIYNRAADKPELRRLNFVLLGVATPSSFIKDRVRTPFNIGVSIELEDFDEKDVDPFKKVLGSDDDLVKRIFHWTGGQPFLVQKIASLVYSSPLKNRTWATVDEIVKTNFLEQKIEKDTHLAFIQDYLLDKSPEVRQTLKLYQKILEGDIVRADDHSMGQNRLKLAGLIKLRENKLTERNLIYKHIFNVRWIWENIPNDSKKLETVMSQINEAQTLNIHYLNLSDNQLNKLPNEIGKLSNLRDLTVENNELTSVPQTVGQLSNLVELHLGNNQITSLPQSFSKLGRLQELYLNNNQLTFFPEPITNLSYLIELNLSNNEIELFPDRIVKLRKLGTLCANNNLITSLTDAIGQLANLEEIHLNKNGISELPDSLCNLSGLRVLYLDDNRIHTLPKSFERITTLNKLHLRNNQLKELPERIGSLTNLVELDLSGNQLSWLPKSLIGMTRLKMLRLDGNEFKVGSEVYNLPPQEQIHEILKWQEAQQGGVLKHVHEAKVIFIGESNYGKTHLIEYLKSGEIKRNIKTTHGIERSQITVQNDNKEIRLNIWDLGGQEFMRSTHQFFFSERTLYVLVTLARRERNELNHWLKLANQLGNQAPVIVVINKIDQNEHDLDRRSLQRDYPNIVGFVRTSIKDSAEGKAKDLMAQLKNLITATVGNPSKMAGVFEKRPTEWFSVKQELEKLESEGKDFISYEQYEKLDFIKTLPEEDRKSNLKLLNMIGAVVSFVDDPRLLDTTVINPQWIMDGVYAIINDPKVKDETKGQLHLKDLERILPKKKFPKSRHGYLLQLMEKFNLCYPAKDQKDLYFIPDLFEDVEPDVEWDSSESMHFRYDYDDFPPDAFMVRFIREIHQDILDDKRWRSGVYISNGSCKAKVYQGFRKNYIHVEVIGNKGEGRSYLYGIRETFRKLHKPFPQMNIKQAVLYKGQWLDYLRLVKLEEKNRLWYHEELDQDLPVAEILNGYSTPKERKGGQKLIKIFLASSSELKEERDQFEIFVNQENQQLYDQGIFIKTVLWEDFVNAMSQTRLQDEYNRAIRDADIFVSLFFTKVGMFTREEFETAFGQFKDNSRPLVYTYFKDAAITTGSMNRKDATSLFDFQDKLKELGHFRTVYKSTEDLHLQFKKQLETVLPKL